MAKQKKKSRVKQKATVDKPGVSLASVAKPTSSRLVSINEKIPSVGVNEKSIELQRTADNLDELDPLTQYTWDLYRVGPWHGFEFSEARLKQYGLHLRKYFATLKIEENVEFKAEFKVLSEFKRTNQDMGVKVEVSCNKDNTWKNIYGGLFLSWGSEREYPETLNHLPLLLCRGRVAVKQVVHDTLQKFFDCLITKIILTHTELIWLNGLFVNMSSPAGNKHTSALKLTLQPPWQSDSRIEYRLILEDAKILWNRIHPEDSDVITAQEVNKLYDALLEHISQKFKFNLQTFRIDQISFPNVSIKASGKLKCKDVDIWNEILHFLCDVPLIDVSKIDLDESIHTISHPRKHFESI